MRGRKWPRLGWYGFTRHGTHLHGAISYLDNKALQGVRAFFILYIHILQEINKKKKRGFGLQKNTGHSNKTALQLSHFKVMSFTTVTKICAGNGPWIAYVWMTLPTCKNGLEERVMLFMVSNYSNRLK